MIPIKVDAAIGVLCCPPTKQIHQTPGTSTMNHHHRKVLHALFAHPISANIAVKDVEAVLRELGAEIDTRHGQRIGVTLKGHTVIFHHPQHSLPKEEVASIRKFLIDCGIDPVTQYPI